MFTILSDIDNEFITKLLDTENNFNFSKDVNTLILNKTYSDQLHSTLYKNIEVLSNKFLYLYSENMTVIDTILCEKIAEFIVLKVISYDNAHKNDFPSNLFSPEFTKFLIDKNFMFRKFTSLVVPDGSTLFNKLVSYEMNYFNIQYDNTLVDNYIECAKDLILFIKNQLIKYVLLNQYEINITTNFIDLMSKHFQNNCEDELFNLTYELYIIFYNGLCNMLIINQQSCLCYKRVFNKITLSTQMLINFNNEAINKLSYLNTLKKKLIHSLVNVDTTCTESELNLLIYTHNADTSLACPTSDKLYIRKKIIDILNSKLTNIHKKKNIISKLEYLDADFSEGLFNLFIDIEKYQPTNGFNSKIKTRSKILQNLTILHTNNSDFIYTSRFISFYTNHINSIFNTIDSILKETEEIHNNMILFKYLIYLQQSIGFNNILIEAHDESGENIYFFKIIETFYSLFESLLKSKLYLDFSFIEETRKNNLIPLNFSKTYENIFSTIFKGLEKLIKKDDFITTWARNSFFLNKETLITTQQEYGDLMLDDCPLKEIINILIDKIEKTTLELEKDIEVYTSDIPAEFIDPIMYIPIDNPVEIPSVEQFLNKYTIYNHLIFNETNPFTNEPLTIIELEEYNSQQFVTERVNIFKNKFREWKTKNKK